MMRLAGFLLATLAPQDSACAFDTAAHLQYHSVILGLAPGWRVTVGDSALPSPPADYAYAAQVIQAFFVAPDSVRLPLWARTIRRGREPGDLAFGLDGHVRFHLANDGHLTNDRIEVSSSSPDIAAAIERALRRADGANAFRPPSRDVRRNRGEIVLHFINADPRNPADAALLRVTIPAIAVDSAPRLLEMPAPAYPVSAQLSDRVIVKVVIGADGVPDASTMELVQARHRELAFGVLGAIPHGRFRPGRTAGCSLPMLVNLPFDFRAR
jgi:hypothetical protein